MKEITHKFIRMAPLSAAAGVMAGIASTVFLYWLDLVTQIRLHTPVLIWTLPICGLVMGLAYHYFGGKAGRGHNLVIEEINDPKETVPARMAPFVLGATILTHLGGGSAGREGAAVQMAASLADQLGRATQLSKEERRSLLVAGAAAGFGSAIGAPIAGVIFGMEMIQAGRLKVLALMECVIATVIAVMVTHLAHAPHTLFPHAEIPPFELYLPFVVVVAGVMFGLVARAFVLLEHGFERVFSLLTYPPLRPFVGGAILAGLFFWEGSLRYCGLGISQIVASLQGPAPLRDPVLKLGFTALTLASGFKGGEFVPLVFIGATLGSAFAAICGLPLPLFASLGFAAVFGAGANTPIACAFMAAELFGWEILPYALIACYCGYLVSGDHGLYKTQPKQGRKRDGLTWWISPGKSGRV